MAITFPLNPVNGVTHIENGITFEYDSTSGSWKKQISIGTLEANTSTFSVTSAVTEEFNRTLGSGVSTDLTLTNDHNDKALVHAKKFIPGDDVTDINWDFDTTDEAQWNFLSDKIEFVDGKVRLVGVETGAGISDISCGDHFTMALMTDGTVKSVGLNDRGQLGIGNTTDQSSWVTSNISGVASILCGAEYAMAVMTDGTVMSVGFNNAGQLGIGNVTQQTSWVTSNISGVASIVCAYRHSMALMSDGTVKGVGRNTYGQLGIGNTTSQSSWVTSNITGVASVSCSQDHSMALMTDGTVKSVGYNNYGQLGTGNTTNQSSWVTSNISGVASISSPGIGYFNMAILTDGTVMAVGQNTNGQLGTGDTIHQYSWVTSNITGVSSIVCGAENFSMALMTDGTVKVVGQNTYGQLGIGNQIAQSSWVTSNISGVASLAGGKSHSMALMTDGTVESTGYNSYGQLGIGNTTWQNSYSWQSSGIQSTYSISFNEPNGTVDSVSSISLSNTATINSLAITENKPTGTDIKYAISFDGKTTWRVPSGAITDITTEGVDATTLATYDFTGFTGTTLDIQSYLTTTDTSVSPDIDLITVGLTVNGTYTQVAIDGVTLLAAESGTNTVTVTNGDATEETYNFMVSVDVPETITVDGIVGGVGATGPAGPDGTIPASHSSTFSVTSAVTEEFNRTLGSGVSTNLTLSNDHNDKALVHAKKFIPGDDVTDINWDFDTTDESQWNFLSDKIEFVDGKVRLVGVTTDATILSIESGDKHTMVLFDDGTVMGVGDNTDGALGIGTTNSFHYDWEISDISDVRHISCGGGHTMAVLNDNSVKGVGLNTSGQLGIGSNISQVNWVVSPLGGGTVNYVVCGSDHSMGLLFGGQLKGVGNNSKNQLGTENNQTSINSWGPSIWKFLSSGWDVSDVFCGYQYTMVKISTNNTVMGIGRNQAGNLGHGSATPGGSGYYEPTWKTSAISGVDSIECGVYHTMALMNDGTVKGVGYNDNGQLGIGTFSGSYVTSWTTSGVSNVSSLKSGGYHSVALLNDGTVKSVGYNVQGQLGTGDTTNQSSWVTSGVTGVASIFCGTDSTFAILSSGDMKSVGRNADGQLGIGNTIEQHSWVDSDIVPPSSTSDYQPSGTVDSLSSISLSNTATINSLAITENKPTGTDIKYAISFDGKTTWRVPAGVITDITTEGVDATTLATYDFTGFTGTTLDIQSYLTTTDTSVSPDIDQITVGLSQNGTYTQVAIDGVTLLAAESGTNTVTVTNGDATETTYNFMVSVDVPETITVDGIVGGVGATGPAGPDGTIPPSHSSTFSVTSAVTEEFNRTLGSGASTNLTLSNDHNDKALVHAKKFIPGDDVTDVNWDFDTTDESQWNFLSDKIEFIDGKVRLLSGSDMTVSSVSIASGTTLILLIDGTVMACGSNNHGQLGLGHTTNVSQLTNTLSNVSSIYAGERHSVAIMLDGSVKSTGYNGYGGLGIGNTTTQHSWTTSNITGSVLSVALGQNHTIVLMTDGTIQGVGYNYYGQLGIGNTTNQTSWVTANITGVSVISGSGTKHWHHAIKSNGEVWGVGSNDYGVINNTNATSRQSTWLSCNLSGASTTINSISCGDNHSLVIMSDGQVSTIGQNNYGNLGVGHDNSVSGWVTTSFSNSVTSVACGARHSLVVLSDGTVMGTGDTEWWQLGIAPVMESDPMMGDYPVPVVVWTDIGVSNVTNVYGGGAYSIILLTNNNIKSIGHNGSGQLGVGNTTNSTSWLLIGDLVFTTDGSVISLSAISLVNTVTINSLAITENKPTGTDIKYAISFDGKTTWRVPAGAITDITTQGVDATTLATYDFTGFTGTTLDIQSYLTTTDTSVSPDIDLITVGLTQNGTYTQVAIDGVTLLASESGTNTVTVTNGDATEETYNFMVSVDVPETITVDGIVGAAGADGTDGGALVHWTETANGNILPNTDNSHDIGSAEYKVRDLYVSDNSIWVGDQHKIEIDATGKMKIRKRKKDVVPASIATAGGDQAAALTHAGVGAVQDMKMHHWINYMRTIGNPNAGTHDVFDFNNTAEVEPDITLDSSDMYTKTEVDTIVSGSGGINTYPTMSNLPLTGVTAGSMAMVLDVNKLYVNNGQGWYFISIINTSPSITGGIDPNYTLDKTGVPTVITVIAEDPEGVPLTYTHSAPTLGNTAVITQNNNAFIVTPSILESDAGAFDLTISASDGINIAAQTTQMSLSFPPPNAGVIFTTVGTHSWTVPTGITEISILMIGGGGGSGNGPATSSWDSSGFSAGGGGSHYRNSVSVFPGDVLTVSVGAGGSGPGTNTYGTSGVDGGNSEIINDTVLLGRGYGGGKSGPAQTHNYNFAYAGGTGGGYESSLGGGGGNGAAGLGTTGGFAGSRAGGYAIMDIYGGGSSAVNGKGGNGASKDNNNGHWTPGIAGTPGVVRILWGENRTFPSTNVDLASSDAGETTV